MSTGKRPTGNFDDHALHLAKRQYMQESDGDISGMFWRVASHIAKAEPLDMQAQWAEKFFDLMINKKFCPGGRIVAGAGTEHGNVLNCFVQAATDYNSSSFEGVMELAKKLALVTKVGGGNGVNLDVYAPKAAKPPQSVVKLGLVYMSADHPDVSDFIEGMMRLPTQPDGDKQPMVIRNWVRVVYGLDISPEIRLKAEKHEISITNVCPPNVMTIPDDMGGIIDSASWVCSKAMSGLEPKIDLSLLRPEGTKIKGSGGTSSGAVSFLVEVFDNFLEWANLGGEKSGPINTLRYVYAAVLRVTRQGGVRRGAGMATISVDHPDVLDFLTAKDLDRETNEGDISTFNISILITEAFWNTLQANQLWPVTPQEVAGKYYLKKIDGPYTGDFPTGEELVPCYEGGIPAKWIWNQIARHAWSTGEPGLIFVDRINEFSAVRNLGEKYQINCTNPLKYQAA